jgi:hypothetical protein
MIRRLLLCAAFCLAALPAFGQGAEFHDIAWEQLGSKAFPAPQATIQVCGESATSNPCTPLTTIYTDETLVTQAANPFTADFRGNFQFWAPPGIYWVSVSGANVSNYTYKVSIGCVPTSGNGCGASTTVANTWTNLQTFDTASGPDVSIGNLDGIILVGSAKYPATGAGIAAGLAAGSWVIVPPGTYTMTATLAIAQSTRLECATPGNGSSEPCVLNFPAATTGITLLNNAAQFSTIRGFYIHSASTVSGTDDCIDQQSHAVILENLVCDGFGRYGVDTDTSVQGNANNSIYRNVRVTNSKADGFHTAGTNSNVIDFAADDATSNTGWGFSDASLHNLYDLAHEDTNTAGGFDFSGTSAAVLDPYCEASGTLKMEAAAVDTEVWGVDYGGCAITDSSTSSRISYWTGSLGSAFNRLQIGGAPGSGVPVYQFNSGIYNGTALALADQTHSTNIWEYDGTNGFNVLAPLKTASIVDGGIAAGTSPICPNGTGGAFTTSGCASGSASFPLLAPNGSSGAPSYSFSAASNTGFYYTGSQLAAVLAGVTQWSSNGSPGLTSYGNLCFTSTSFCLGRDNDPNSVFGVGVSAGSVFGVPVVAGDVTTTGWGASQDGRFYWNSSAGLFRTWNGSVLVSVANIGANGISAGTVTLASGAGSHTFTTAYGTAPICTASDQTSAAAVKVTSSTTAVTLAGTGTDVIAWICTPSAN